MKLTLQRLGQALARLTVGVQISVAFGAVLLLTASLGGVSLWSLSHLDDSTDELNVKWLRGVGQLAHARAAIVEAREFEIKHSRASDRSYHASTKRRSAMPSRSPSSLAVYAPLPPATTSARRSRPSGQGVAVYHKARPRCWHSGKDKKQQDAADISDGAASMAIDETIGALGRLDEAELQRPKAPRRMPPRCTCRHAGSCWRCWPRRWRWA